MPQDEDRRDAPRRPPVAAAVGADEFATMEWVIPEFGSHAIPESGRGTKEDIRVCIQEMSKEVASRIG